MKEGRDNYNRLYELLCLIDTLRRSLGGLSYEDIRGKFGWERRTAERMLGIIEMLYFRSFVKERRDDKRVYFRLAQEDRFPPNSVSQHEIVALKTALGFVKTNEPLRLPLESLAAKLEVPMKDAEVNNIEDLALASGTASAPRPRLKVNRKIFDPLQEAVLACLNVKIDYKLGNRAPSQFTLSPLGFLYSVHNNYLVASYVNDVDHPRHFILNQILGVKLTKKEFDAKGFNIHKYAELSFGAWIAHRSGYKVKWLVKPEAAERAAQFVFHPTQKVTKQEDGSLLVEFTADGLREMAWHLMTWEGNIRPIAPKELVDEYKNQLKLAAKALSPKG